MGGGRGNWSVAAAVAIQNQRGIPFGTISMINNIQWERSFASQIEIFIKAIQWFKPISNIRVLIEEVAEKRRTTSHICKQQNFDVTSVWTMSFCLNTCLHTIYSLRQLFNCIFICYVMRLKAIEAVHQILLDVGNLSWMILHCSCNVIAECDHNVFYGVKRHLQLVNVSAHSRTILEMSRQRWRCRRFNRRDLVIASTPEPTSPLEILRNVVCQQCQPCQ